MDTGTRILVQSALGLVLAGVIAHVAGALAAGVAGDPVGVIVRLVVLGFGVWAVVQSIGDVIGKGE